MQVQNNFSDRLPPKLILEYRRKCDKKCQGIICTTPSKKQDIKGINRLA